MLYIQITSRGACGARGRGAGRGAGGAGPGGGGGRGRAAHVDIARLVMLMGGARGRAARARGAGGRGARARGEGGPGGVALAGTATGLRRPGTGVRHTVRIVFML